MYIKTLPTLQQVDDYQVPELLIPRVAQQHGYSIETATLLVREAKRMLYLYAITKTPVSPSKHVDMAWHEMLMFTRFYRDFAKFIGVFVHHNPEPGMPDGGKTYSNTKVLYKKTFGDAPNVELWP